jgi:hypothetical protein
MNMALRFIPRRRQLPALTDTTIESMPELDPIWDREPIPAFAHGSPFATSHWGRRSFTRPEEREAFTERPDQPPPSISEQTGETPPIPADDVEEDQPTSDSSDTSLASPRRRPSIPFESLQIDGLSPIHQAAIATCCRLFGWPDFHSQVADLAKCLREGSDPLSWRQIGRIFGLTGSTVASHVSGHDWTAGPFGRPTVLTSSQRTRIVEFVRAQFEIRKPVTFSDLTEFVETELAEDIVPDTLRHYIHRLPEFKVIEGIPFEAERLEADPAQIEEYFDCFQRILVDLPAAMVVNLDETGHCEWVDSRIEKVIVPIEFPDANIPMPVNRQSTRSTLLGAITADGGRLKPLVIVSRETLETELYENGLSPSRVMYAKQENAFITRDLFEKWANEVLFPDFSATRASLQYDGHGIVLLDGCSAHLSDYIEDECVWQGIEYIFLPPHSSDQVQPMDLGIFAVQKMEAARCRPSASLNPQSKKIIRMVDGYFRATCPDNVIGALRRAGITCEWDSAKHCLIAKVAREGAGSIRDWHFSKVRIAIGEEQ